MHFEKEKNRVDVLKGLKKLGKSFGGYLGRLED
jgi:hypothetical protein